jgi:uncharacterized protein YjbI with pentapeptide repeats
MNAHLEGADLEGVSLVRAYLDGASLRGANLRDTILWSAVCSGVDLAEADLAGAVFGDTILTDANLTRAMGLDKCEHREPSGINFRTLQVSGNLPVNFLRGCGLTDSLIDYLPSLLNQALQF